MKLDRNKIFSFMLAAAFALTLAGCGGSGGTATDDEMVTPEPTPEQMCTDAGNVYVDGACITPAQHAFNMCVAGGGRDNGDGTCTSAADLAAEAKVERLTKSAGTKEKAIGAEAASDGLAGLGGRDSADPPVPVTTYSYTISRDDDGITVKVTDTALNDDDDPKFEEAMGFDNGSMQVRTMKENDDGETVSEVIVVRTDIAAPTPRPFAVDGDNKGVYTLDVDLDPSTDADNDGTATNDFTALAIDESDADSVGKVMSDEFSASSVAVLTYLPLDNDTDDTTPGNQRRAAAQVMGTYDGAAGIYQCNTGDGGANCTVTLDAKGDIDSVSTGWIFIPADDVTVDVDDSSYLSYGFWLKRTAKDGATTYNNVETFAMAHGIVETGDSDLADVTGTAIYEGGAAGVYVKNVTDNQGATVTATSGQFTADVTLNASFGGGNVAANNQFTIDGDITGFVLHPTEGDGPEDNDWAVKLELTDFSGRTTGNDPGESAPGTSHANTFSGDAQGDSTAAAGSWSGAFHGSSASTDHDDDATTPNINPQPTAVIGEFNANFTDGTVAGAYGANKQ